MLDLYTHEIPCPTDRAVSRYLWHDAFRGDPIVSGMHMETREDDLILRVEHSGLRGSLKPGAYLLRFHGVIHFGCAGDPYATGGVIHSMIFLDSALLHALEAESGRPLYHLRIITWAGYADVVYDHFSIRREGGHMDYRLPEADGADPAAERAHAIREAFDRAHAQLALCMADVGDRDLDEFHATELWLLNAEGDPRRSAERAREVLEQPLMRNAAWTFAAHVLGLHGSAEDIPRLTRLLLALPAHECLRRRIVLDALDRLHERTKGAVL